MTWVDAKCDKRTDLEKKIWKALKYKTGAQQTTAEKAMTEMLLKKHDEQFGCELEVREQLTFRAYEDAVRNRR
jgi:hypothetical protein